MNRILSRLLISEPYNLPALLRDWGEDTKNFLRHDVPKIVFVVFGALVLIRVLRVITRGMSSARSRKLAPGLRTQQVQTLANVINSI